MLIHEIFVTPFFESRIVTLVVLVAYTFDSAMEVDCVFVEQVTRSQIASATKPPGIATTVMIRRLEVSVVHMHCWRHWILGVQNQAQPCGEELKSLNTRIKSLMVRSHPLNSSSWKNSIDDGSIHTSLLKHIPILKDACYATTSMRSDPG